MQWAWKLECWKDATVCSSRAPATNFKDLSVCQNFAAWHLCVVCSFICPSNWYTVETADPVHRESTQRLVFSQQTVNIHRVGIGGFRVSRLGRLTPLPSPLCTTSTSPFPNSLPLPYPSIPFVPLPPFFHRSLLFLSLPTPFSSLPSPFSLTRLLLAPYSQPFPFPPFRSPNRRCHCICASNFAKCWPILKIVSPTDLALNF